VFHHDLAEASMVGGLSGRGGSGMDVLESTSCRPLDSTREVDGGGITM
jgi:hypothetical protein